MNLEEEIIETLGNEIAREIDNEIIWGMLIGIGWTKVILKDEIAMVNATSISTWLDNNCSKMYKKHRSSFLFEIEKDATMFILRWSS